MAVMVRRMANIAMNAVNVLTATRRPSARLRKCLAGRTAEVITLPVYPRERGAKQKNLG